jgi:glutamate racemase
MKKESTTIGIFDSGIGGITVLKEILDLVPGADFLYLGDSARLPYGTKSPKTIVRYSVQCAEFLVAKGIDMLVVACNTASSHALPDLRAMFPIPVIGVVESGSRAAIDTGGKRIGVIGTSSTIKSGSYVRVLQELKPDVEVFSKACPLFVSLVEEGWCSDSITEQVAARYLEDLKEANVDTLLLGCTHYPLLKSIIARVMGDGVSIVDSARSTARVVSGLVNGGRQARGDQELSFYLSDLSPTFIKLGELFLGKKMERIFEVDLCI